MPAGGWNRRHTDDELLAAIREHGSQRAAIKALGVSTRNFQRRVKALRMRGYTAREATDVIGAKP